MKAKMTRNLLVLVTLVLICTLVLGTTTAFADYEHNCDYENVFTIYMLGMDNDDFKSYSRMIVKNSPPMDIYITVEFNKFRESLPETWLLAYGDQPSDVLILEDPLPTNIFFVDTYFELTRFSTSADNYRRLERKQLVWTAYLLKIASEGVNVHLYVSEEDTDNAFINRWAVMLLEMASYRSDKVTKNDNFFVIEGDDEVRGTITVHREMDSEVCLDNAIRDILAFLWAK